MIDTRFVGHDMGSLTAEIDKTMIRRFAYAIGETDPIFYDEAAAKAAGYPAMPAPITFPIVLKSMVQTTPIPKTIMSDSLAAMGVQTINMLHGEQDIVAKRPLYDGETVTLRSRVESIDNKPERNMTILKEVATIEVEGEGAVAEMRCTYVIRHPKQG